MVAFRELVLLTTLPCIYILGVTLYFQLAQMVQGRHIPRNETRGWANIIEIQQQKSYTYRFRAFTIWNWHNFNEKNSLIPYTFKSLLNRQNSNKTPFGFKITILKSLWLLTKNNGECGIYKKTGAFYFMIVFSRVEDVTCVTHCYR